MPSLLQKEGESEMISLLQSPTYVKVRRRKRWTANFDDVVWSEIQFSKAQKKPMNHLSMKIPYTPATRIRQVFWLSAGILPYQLRRVRQSSLICPAGWELRQNSRITVVRRFWKEKRFSKAQTKLPITKVWKSHVHQPPGSEVFWLPAGVLPYQLRRLQQRSLICPAGWEFRQNSRIMASRRFLKK
jgi:hypothetical protein